MRKKLPPIHESAGELHQRMKSEPAGKKRQRLQALYLVASGQARHRQEVARLLGVHRHSVAAWLEAYATGGIDHALHSHRVPPPVHRRITDAALTALQDKLREPHGFAGYDQIRVWLAEAHQGSLAYSSVHALVQYKLKATPKRPRPSHVKKVPRP